MLQFEPFSDTLLIKVLPHIRENRSLCSEFSAGYLYMWNKETDVRFCLWNETLSISETIGEQVAFSYPIGADPEGMIDELKAYAYQTGCRFASLPRMKRSWKRSGETNVFSRPCGPTKGAGATTSTALKTH